MTAYGVTETPERTIPAPAGATRDIPVNLTWQIG